MDPTVSNYFRETRKLMKAFKQGLKGTAKSNPDDHAYFWVYLIPFALAVGEPGNDVLTFRVGKSRHDDLIFIRGSKELNFTRCMMRGFLLIDPEGFDSEEDFEFWVEKV